MSQKAQYYGRKPEGAMRAKAAEVPRDEKTLIGLVKRGDQQAFDELFGRYQSRCLARAISFLKNRQDAEDEVQNAFLHAFERIHQFRGEAEFSAWLLRIVTNQCLMLLRSRRHARHLYLDEGVGGEDKSTQLPAADPDPEGVVGSAQISNVIRRELHRVPPLLRDVVIHRDLEALPMAKVANLLGISMPAAKSRLVRGRLELRVRLKTHFDCIGPSTPLSLTAVPLYRVARRSVA